MADKMTGLARAALGQGLGMGWGDEAEAWLRSKLTDEQYEPAVKRIRNEYAQYSKENPWTSGLAEFGGGMIPGVAAMLIPGGQAAGGAQIARSTMGTMARMGALGALSGAVSGAGNATEGHRLGGATAGAVLGGTLGAAMPLATKGLSASGKWLAERLAPTDERITQRAAEKMNTALARNQMKPIDISRQNIADKRLGVPSVVGNTSPALSDLTKVVVQRSGEGANKVEEALVAQKLGGRERIMQQVKKQMEPGSYYDDLERLESQLSARSKPAYAEAYARGDVNEPRILELLKEPQVQGLFEQAKKIADLDRIAAKLRGEDTSGAALREIYKLGKDAQGNTVVQGVEVPDVRTLDYIKRGMDSAIKAGFKGEGMSTAEATGLKEIRKEFLKILDDAVPEYKKARGVFSGGAQLREAMEKGLNDFNGMNHEEVQKLVRRMGPEEKEAFRTGVARNLYATVMNPSNEPNVAARIIGSPESREKLAPLFDSPEKYDLFEAALKREAQLYQQASKALGGSDTARNLQARADFESDPDIGQAMGQAAVGNWGNALSNLASRFVSKSTVSDKTAAKLADMLMSKDPHEVAAVVRLLEKEAAGAAPRALAAGAGTAGAITGTTSAGWPAPVETADE